MHRGRGSTARRQAARDDLHQARKVDRLIFRARVAERDGHVPWPRWAKELARELDRENGTHRAAALADGGGSYVPPIRQPYAETAALLQHERDRLTQHLIDATAAQVKQRLYLHHVATAERAKAGVGRSEPVPLRGLGTMLAAERVARRRHAEPPRPGLLPLSPRAPQRLDTVRHKVSRVVALAPAPSEPTRAAVRPMAGRGGGVP